MTPALQYRRTSRRWRLLAAFRPVRIVLVLGLVLASGIFTLPASAAGPANSAPPTVSGTAAVGSTLTAAVGTWAGDPTFTFAWQRSDASGNWTSINGETGQTYVARPADVDLTLRANVTATAGSGSTTVPSAATAVVRNGADAPAATTAAPADALGTPANSRVLSVDQLLLTSNEYLTRDSTVPGAIATLRGKVLTPAAGIGTLNPNSVTLNGQRSLTGPAIAPETPQPTATGRFADQNADGVLGVHVASSEGALQKRRVVVSPDSVAASASEAGSPITGPFQPGTAYLLEGGYQGTSDLIGGADDSVIWQSGSPAFAASATWSATAVVGQPNWVMLVNRATGRCLEAGSPVTLTACVWTGAVPTNLLWQTGNQSTSTAQGSLTSKAFSGQAATHAVPGGNVTMSPITSPVGPTQGFLSSPVTASAGGKQDNGANVPTWASPDFAFAPPTGVAIAAGDLDRASDYQGTFTYHDEAVVAWVGPNNVPQIRVLDYTATPNSITATAPSVALPAVGTGLISGAIGLAVGDFDGDSLNEIAFTWQDAQGLLRLTLLKYRQTASGPALDPISPPAGTVLFGLDQAGAPSLTVNQSSWRMADTRAGDFEGSGRDDLAVAYAATPAGATATAVYLGVVNFTSTADSPTIGINSSDSTRVGNDSGIDPVRGVQLRPGLFRYDPATGFTMGRRQLAVAYSVQDPQEIGIRAVNTAVHVFSADDGTCSGDECQFALDELYGNGIAVEQDGNGGGPLSLAAGGFRGPSDNGQPPLWNIAVAANGTADVPNGLTVSGTLAQVAIVNGALQLINSIPLPTLPGPNAEPVNYALTSYDPTGSSLELGAPAIVSVSNLEKATIIAAQPPSQADWAASELRVNPKSGFVNTSRTGKVTVDMTGGTTTSYQSTTTHSAGFSTGLSVTNDAKASFEANAGIVAGGVAAEDQLALNENWKGTSSSRAQYSSSQTDSFTAATNDDDSIRGEVQNETIYRYPILGGPAPKSSTCQSTCYGFYEIAIPGLITDATTDGSTTSFYNPTWENGNIFSYPTIGTVQTPPDLGSYTYYDASGTLQTSKPTVLATVQNTIGGNSGSESLKITTAVGAGNSTSTSNSWSLGNNVSLSANVKVGGFAASDKLSIGYNNGKSFAATDSGQTVNTSASGFTVNAPEINSGRSYDILTQYYYDTAGTARVGEAVNVPGGDGKGGQTYWGTVYNKPDPALSLPNAIEMTPSTTTSPTLLQFSTNSEGQEIRGFQVLHTQNQPAAQSSLAGTPYTTNPLAGDSVQFSVPIHNYSLVAASNVPVSMYAMPMTADYQNDATKPTLIGTTTINSIPAQGTVTFSEPWTASINDASSTNQTWRIFIQIDPAGTLSEMHPLKGGPACPAADIDTDNGNNLQMPDPLTNVPGDLACGQNNQGFGAVTVSSPTDQPQSLRPRTVLGMATSAAVRTANVRFSGVGVADKPKLDATHHQLGASEIPTIKLNQTISASTFATADTASAELQPVIIYDGPVAADNVVAITKLTGVGANGTGRADFTWKGTTPGVHVFTAKLLGSPTAGGDDTTTFKIRVLAAPAIPKPPAEPVLPNTGGGPLTMFMITGFLLLALGATGAVIGRRRRTTI